MSAEANVIRIELEALDARYDRVLARAERMREAIEEALALYDTCCAISPIRAQKLRDSLVEETDSEKLSPLTTCPRCGSVDGVSKTDTVNCRVCGTVWHRFGSELPPQQRGYGG